MLLQNCQKIVVNYFSNRETHPTGESFSKKLRPVSSWKERINKMPRYNGTTVQKYKCYRITNIRLQICILIFVKMSARMLHMRVRMLCT